MFLELHSSPALRHFVYFFIVDITCSSPALAAIAEYLYLGQRCQYTAYTIVLASLVLPFVSFGGLPYDAITHQSAWLTSSSKSSTLTTMSTSESLTSHLVRLSTVRSYTAATEHPFLASAGDGRLSKDLLSVYLSQDRLYAAHAYPKFVGCLLASVPFSSLDGIDCDRENYNQRVVAVLGGALQNVIREVNFFRDVAEKYGLQLSGWRERKATRDYTAEMSRVGASGRLEDGIVFLWAMERVSAI